MKPISVVFDYDPSQYVVNDILQNSRIASKIDRITLMFLEKIIERNIKNMDFIQFSLKSGQVLGVYYVSLKQAGRTLEDIMNNCVQNEDYELASRARQVKMLLEFKTKT